jgi:hypothetical protein
MDLYTWLCKNRVKQSTMARHLKLHNQTIHNLIHQDITPTLAVAVAIEKYTEGEVPIFDLLSTKDRNNFLKLYSHKIYTLSEAI